MFETISGRSACPHEPNSKCFVNLLLHRKFCYQQSHNFFEGKDSNLTYDLPSFPLSPALANEVPQIKISKYASQFVFPGEPMVFEVELANIGVGK